MTPSKFQLDDLPYLSVELQDCAADTEIPKYYSREKDNICFTSAEVTKLEERNQVQSGSLSQEILKCGKQLRENGPPCSCNLVQKLFFSFLVLQEQQVKMKKPGLFFPQLWSVNKLAIDQTSSCGQGNSYSLLSSFQKCLFFSSFIELGFLLHQEQKPIFTFGL